MSEGILGLGAVRHKQNSDQQRSEQKREAAIQQWIDNNFDFVQKMKTMTKDELVYLLIKDLIGGAYDKVIGETESEEHKLEKGEASLALNMKLLEGSTEEKLEALIIWEVARLKIAGNNIKEVAEVARIAGATSARIDTLPMVRAVKAQNNGLKKAQVIGAKSQKDYAAETNRIIEQLNDDLLGHINTARWGLKERAIHIEKKLIELSRNQLNGNPYTYGVIYKKITGKG